MNTPPPVSHLMHTTARPPVVFTHGSGSRLYDATGRDYLDWVQGWAVNSLGHSPAVLVEALRKQAGRVINPGAAFFNEPSLALAEWLVAHTCFDQVFFTSSGAEANEGAVKLARKWGALHRGGAHEIITFHNSFHGRTLAMTAATGKAGWEAMFAPMMPGFVKAVFNDLDSVAGLIGAQTVAIMLEPIQGEAGVIPASRTFMQGLRQLCDTHGLLLIVDEVQTGCGRTGSLFAHQSHAIEPDVMTLGKGIGGGIPLAALLARERACCFAPGDQGGTYTGNPLMCAGGLAVMDEIGKPAFLQAVQARGARLRRGLETLSQRHGHGEVRGAGLLLALQLSADIGPALVARARDGGLLLNAPRPDSLRLMPALNIEEAELDEGLAILDSLL